MWPGTARELRRKPARHRTCAEMNGVEQVRPCFTQWRHGLRRIAHLASANHLRLRSYAVHLKVGANPESTKPLRETASRPLQRTFCISKKCTVRFGTKDQGVLLRYHRNCQPSPKCAMIGTVSPLTRSRFEMSWGRALECHIQACHQKGRPPVVLRMQPHSNR